MSKTASVRAFCLGVLVAVAGHAARAQAPYQGIYVLLNPYAASDVALLQTAAQAPCPQDPAATVTPFCGAASGVLLRVNWCDFQLYHVSSPSGAAYPSCHYAVGYSGGVGSAGVQMPVTDTISPCSGAYDTCSGAPSSVLGAALQLIAQINTQRQSAGLPPLQLSVGLSAGDFSPQTVFDTAGYVDAYHNASQIGDATKAQCIRLPLVWESSYISAYNAGIDQLLAYIQSQFGGGANLTILKPAAIVATTMEIGMPGHTNVIIAPADPGPAGPGPAVTCSTTISGAQTWLNAYNAAPNKKQNFSQAVENAFGGMIGHAYGALANNGLPGALLSIPTNNSTALAMVNCGINGGSKCNTKANTGDWSIYYFEKYVNDLFQKGLSGTAAAAAYRAIRGGTFVLPPAQLAVDWTAVSPAPVASSTQSECALNNTSPSLAPTFILNKTPVVETGAGTGLGWQTAFNSANQCNDGSYMTTLNNALANGGLFIEVESDAAFTNISACSPYLTGALNAILAVTPPTVCQY